MFRYLREALKDEIDVGFVAIIDDVTDVFMAIESNFPTRTTRIAWERVAGRHEVDVLSTLSAISSDELRRELTAHRVAVESWLVDHAVVPPVEVKWVGDMCDAGFRMPPAVFLDHFELLFSLPQHAYVLPGDARWCLNYVMEGQLYFGTSTQ